MDSASRPTAHDEVMELDRSFILAVMKATSSSDGNTQSAASRVPAPPLPPHSRPPLDLAPQIGRRRRAGSDPTEYGGRRRQRKRLQSLLPTLAYSMQPLVPRLPYWTPQIFDYSRFDHHDEAQKAFKEMAAGNQDELTWKTNFLNNVAEHSLLGVHWNWAERARKEAKNLGGLEGERRFLKGLRNESRKDGWEVVFDDIPNNERFGKTEKDRDEVYDFLDSLMAKGYEDV